jgi:hypothetical protein
MSNDLPQLKLCTNCRWIATSPDRDWERHRCLAPQNKLRTCLVDGHAIYATEFCYQNREAVNRPLDYPPRCEVEGNWFEPKPLIEQPLQTITFSPRDKVDALLSKLDNLGPKL